MTKRKKVLFLHTGAELYGADQILLTTVINLDKSKYESFVVLPNTGPLVEKFHEHNINVEIIPYPIIRRKYFCLSGIIKYLIELKKSKKSLTKYIKKNEIDIIHNNTIAVLEGIFLKKKGLILITHVHEMMDKPRLVAKLLYKFHLTKCDKMIVVSNHVKEHIQTLLNKTYPEIVVIHNGIEKIDVCEKKDNYRNELRIPSNAKVVGIVGRINAIKGQDHFVKAMKKVIEKDKNVYGLIIGDAFPGQEWRIDDLKKIIEESNLQSNIIYCGFRNDAKELYQIFDILILSSIQNDSFPTVVLEAMSCGVPTIAYKCGGVEEMVEDGKNGFLVKQGDIEELSKTIDYALHKPAFLKESKINSLTKFNKEFTVANYAENILKIYDKCGEKNE